MFFWVLFTLYGCWAFAFWCSKIEGSQATAKQTAELLRSVISQHRVPYSNQAGALIDAVKAVGEQLIAANPIGTLIAYGYDNHACYKYNSRFNVTSEW